MSIVADLIDSAQDYAQRGWQVVILHGQLDGICSCVKREDCPSPAKHPRLAEWQNRATCDAKTIEKWFSDWPQSNVGVRLGPASGIIDVEFDDAEGEATAGRLLGDIETPTFASTRSVHRLFQFPEGLSIPTAVVKAQGLELRFGTDERGAQSVFPPSVHASGLPYRWLDDWSPDDVGLAPFPESLAQLIGSPGNGSGSLELVMGSDSDDLASHPGGVAGQRNTKLCELIGRFLKCNGPTADLLPLAFAWARRCEPPYPDGEVLQTVGDLIAKESAKGIQASKAKPAFPMRTLAQVSMKPTEFGFGNRLAFGHVNVFAGDGDVGKTTLACDIASRLSQGICLPGDTKVLSCGTFFITAEDGGNTIRSRIEAMGGDLNRIHVPDEGHAFDSFRQDIAKLRVSLSDNPDVRLVIFDTLPDFVGENVDDHKNAGVRQALRSLIRLAEDYNIAALGICHFNKGDGKPGSRLLGSVAYRNLPRSVVYVLHNPDAPEGRIVWHEKSNLSAKAEPLAFSLAGADGKPPAIQWQPGHVYVDDISTFLNANPKRKPNKVGQAKDWLAGYLPPGASKASDELLAAGKQAGHGRTHLYDAAKDLCIEKDRQVGLWANPKSKTLKDSDFGLSQPPPCEGTFIVE